MRSTIQKTWKLGIFVFNLIILAGFVCAALPGDLNFSLTPDSAEVGTNFIAKLVISPSGGPGNIFNGYDNATISLPGGIVLRSGTALADLSAVDDINEYKWHLNSTSGIGSPYQINISVNGDQFNASAAMTITDPAALPKLVAAIPAIADNRIIGNPESVTVQIDNTGAGAAKDIVGYISSQKAGINTSSFTISNLTAAGSTTFDIELTPSQSGNGNLLVGFSSYKKSDNTLISPAHPDYDAAGDTEAFTVNADPVISLPASLYIGDSGTSSLDLDDYAADADTALADLTWACSDDNANITLNLNPITHLLNLTAGNGSYSGVLTCNVTDTISADTGSMIINVHRVNDPPEFTSTPVTSVYLGDSYSYNTDAADEEGDTFTFSLTTAPEGMAIKSGSGEISWTPVSTGSYDVTVKVTDSQSNINLQSFTIDVGTRPSSSGGSGGKAKSPQETGSWKLIEEGKPVIMKISDDKIFVEEIEITSIADIEDAYIRIEKVSVLPQSMQDSAPDRIFQFFLIVNLNIDDEDIESAIFRFRVPKSWISEEGLGYEDIVLKRYHDNAWKDLPASITGQDSSYVSYEAVSPGFSYFAVGAKGELEELAEGNIEEEIAEEEPAAEEQQEEEITEEEKIAEEEKAVEEKQEEEKIAEEEDLGEGITRQEYSKLPLVLAVSAIVVVIAALIIASAAGRDKKKKSIFIKIKEGVVSFFVEDEKAPKRKPGKR